MQFFLLFFAYLMGLALALPSHFKPRDTANIDQSLDEVSRTFTLLNDAVRVYRSDPKRDSTQQQMDIGRKGQKIMDAFEKGADQIRQGPVMTEREFVRVAVNVELTISQMQQTMSILIAAKPTIVAAGGRNAMLQMLSGQQQASVKFTGALVSRMPHSVVANLDPGDAFDLRFQGIFGQAINMYS